MFTNLDDPNQPYSCNQWGNRHVQWGDEDAVITADNGYTMFNWFNTGNAFPSVVFIDHTMTVDYMANFPGGENGGINRINNLLDDCGSLCSNEPIAGCTDEGACNYNEGADEDDGSCEYESCLGCTDPLADNYDSDAIIDDGTCSYPVNIAFGQISSSTIDIMLSNNYDVQGFQFTITDFPDEITLTGASGGRAEDANFTVSTSNLGIVIGFSFSGDVIPPGDGILTTLTYDGVGPTDICFEDVFISDTNGNAIGAGIDDCTLLDIVANPGDTNLDNTINVQDIVVLLNFILGYEEPNQQQFVNGDMNSDGILNVLDVIRIVNDILGEGRVNNFDNDSFGSVQVQRFDGDLILSIYSESDYSGVQIVIESDYNHEIILKDNSHITLEQNYVNNQKIAVAYSIFNNIFDGHTAEFRVKDGADLAMDKIDIIVGDIYGNSIDLIYNDSNININDNYSFNIENIYPNPFNPSTDINFSIPEEAYVRLSVFNINGQEIDVIFEGHQDSGYHSYTWNASGFASGIYYFNLVSGKNISTAKAILVK